MMVANQPDDTESNAGTGNNVRIFGALTEQPTVVEPSGDATETIIQAGLDQVDEDAEDERSTKEGGREFKKLHGRSCW